MSDNSIWDNEIVPLINQRNRLITMLYTADDGSSLPKGKLRRGIADQIIEINGDLEQYPQYLKRSARAPEEAEG